MAGNIVTPAKSLVETLRLDKWLWHSRIFRSRTLAAEAVSDGSVRVNGQRVTKPGRAVRAGDTLTIGVDGMVRLIRVSGIGARRGPPTEASALYCDLDTQAPRRELPLNDAVASNSPQS